MSSDRKPPAGRIPVRQEGEDPERIMPEQMKFCPDHVARYRFACQWAPGSRMLDLCCGTGYGTVMLGASGAESVLGVDLSPEAIQAATSHWHPPQVCFAEGNAMALGRSSEFDVAVCFEGLEHVPDGRALVRSVATALLPEGIALISTPHAAAQPGGHSGNPFHVKEYYLKEFQELLRSSFRTVKLYFQRRNDPLDTPWTAGRALKSLVPAGLRRGRWTAAAALASPSPGPTGEAWLAYDTVDRWYPRAWDYLGYPGMEPGFQPTVLIGVCQGPLAG